MNALPFLVRRVLRYSARALVMAGLLCASSAVELSHAQPAPKTSSAPATVRDKGALAVADLRFDNYLGIVSTNLEARAGDEAGMKFFVEGFSREERKDEGGRPEYSVHLKYSINISDPAGKPRSEEHNV